MPLGASGLTAEDSPDPSKMPSKACRLCLQDVKGDFSYCYPCFQFMECLKSGDCEECGKSVLQKYRLCFACNSKRRGKNEKQP